MLVMHEYVPVIEMKSISTLRITTVYNQTKGRSMSQLHFRFNNRNICFKAYKIRHSKGKCPTELFTGTNVAISYFNEIGWLNN